MQKYLKRNERIQGYIKEILDDCKKHKTSEIVECVDKRLRDNGECIFQVNTYVNSAMKGLMIHGEYAKVAYGVYQKGGIPYTPTNEMQTERNRFPDFNSVITAIRAYLSEFNRLFSEKPPFKEMDNEEEASYSTIKVCSLDAIKELRKSVNDVIAEIGSQEKNERNVAIRKYFMEFLSDGQPHRMNEISNYVFSKMIENGEYGGERSTAYIYWAINTMVDEEGAYRKITRGVYQKNMMNKEVDKDAVFSMDEVNELLDKGFDLLNSNIAGALKKEYIKNDMCNDDGINTILKNLEYSVDNISYLLAFAEDYMDNHEEVQYEQGMQGISGM